MENDAQLKLQAYLDGELPEAETREVAKWLAQDQEAVLLLGELRNTRQALVGAEKLAQLPESREFFWSKIEREISRLEQPEGAPKKESFLAVWRRFLVPAGAVAAVAVALLITVGPQGGPESESETEDSAAFTYRDYAAQATLVWFSYPADNDEAQTDAPSSTR